MKKIDKLFIEFSELRIIEVWIRKSIKARGKNPIKNIFSVYRVRKPKKFDEMINILKNSKDNIQLLRASWYVEMSYNGNLYFDYLNKCFSKLKNQKGFHSLLKRIKNNPEEFNDVLSEIEFNAYFAKRYVLEIEPKIGNKKLDSKINLEKRNVLFEIFTPKSYKPLEESKKAIIIPNTSKLKILSKLREQIIPIKEYIKQPLIIVINASNSVIDEYDIANSLFGELKLVTLQDKITGKMIGEYWGRDKNSLFHIEPLAELITGVLIYRRNITINKTEFKKELILNKKSKYHLTHKEYKKLNRFDLNNIL